MLRTAEVYAAVVDLLIEDKRQWTVSTLTAELAWRTFGLDIGQYHVRRAVSLLPAQCIERRGRRLFISARFFAPTPELVATIRKADEGLHIPLMLNDERRRELRRTLVLQSDWALHKSIEWAANGGQVEYSAGYGSMFVRVIQKWQ